MFQHQIPNSCVCLYPAQAENSVVRYLIENQDTCGQKEPWCFVGSQSACPDIASLQTLLVAGGIQLFYSSKACVNHQ